MKLEQNKKIQEFLDAVCQKVRNQQKRTQIRCELFGHLEDFVEDKTSNGLSLDDAIELAILKLGNPVEIGLQFNKVHRPWYMQPIAIVLSLIFFSIFSGLLYSELIFLRSQKKSQDYQKQITAKIDLFLNDQNLISSDNFFALPGKKHDAGELLNSKIQWSYDESSPLSILMNRWPEIIPPPDLRAKLNGSWSKSWVDHAKAVTKYDLDLSWMNELNHYDHWDLFAFGPLSDVIKSGRSNFNIFTMPVPDLGALQTLAKLRLMKGLAEKNLFPALREVRQLAKLIFSQEMLGSELIAIAILRSERQAFEKGATLGLINSEQWQAYESEFLDRARRATFAYSGLFDLNTDSTVLKSVFYGSSSHAGLCASLSEGMVRVLIGRTFMVGNLPFESAFEEKLKLLNHIVQQRGSECRLPYAKLIWKDDTNFISTIFSDPKNFSSVPSWTTYKYLLGRHIPFYRRAIGAELIAIATPSFFVGNY